MKEGVSCEKKMKIGTAEKSDRTLYIPDEIIHLFLSLVDARTAVQTCVFSRKWRNIWASLPFLNFRTCKFTSVVSYRKFVDEFLTHRKDKSKSNITSIVIDLKDFAAPEIERVFRFAIDRNVQKIEMYNLVFAGALNFEFLKSLCLIECTVSLMDWNCPVLQTLHLDDTLGYAGSNEPILNLERFLRLEILILERCVGTGDGPEVIEIRSNTISTLSLLDMGFSDLRICTPNVSSFNFISQHVPTIIFPDGLPSLETAQIDVHVDKYDKYIWEDFEDGNRDHQIKETINLFRAMSETEFIIVSQHTIKVLDAASNLSKYQPPCFRRLRSINLPRQLPTEDRMPSNSPDQVIRYLVKSSPDSNIFVQDRWMRIREYKPKEHILVRDDLGGYSVLTSTESIASEIHVQVQSYIEEHEREIAKREAELSHREAEIARQEARLKMERKILEKEKSLLMGAACSLDNQDEALRIALLDNKIQEAKSKKDTLEARALFAETASTVSEVLGNVNTSNALSAFEKMEEKVTAMESEADALNQPSSDDFAGQKKELPPGQTTVSTDSGRH